MTETQYARPDRADTGPPTASPEPVFILAPPCTFSWAVCAMLGEHPQLYGLPELHLFSASTVAEWWELCTAATFEMDHGLVRAVAELYFDGQTDVCADHARGWLRRRSHFTTGLLLEAVLDRLSPLIAVEKSPSIVHSAQALQRAFDMFPDSRFIHLVSHPRLFGELIIESLREAEAREQLSPSHWLVQLASGGLVDGHRGELDPQVGWFAAHRSITEFLARVPEPQRTTVRGEQLVGGDPDVLRSVAQWLHVRSDDSALEAMKHPERSPYARLGPSSAQFGSDAFLREGPLIDPTWTEPRRLEGPLGWRAGGGSFLPHVSQLARRLGYT